MLCNTRKLGVLRKILKHQVASQSFHALLLLATAITLTDILQKLKITVSTLTPALNTWKCRGNSLDVADNSKLALVDSNNGSKIIVATYQSRTFSAPLRRFWSVFSSASSSFACFHTTLATPHPLTDRLHRP